MKHDKYHLIIWVGHFSERSASKSFYESRTKTALLIKVITCHLNSLFLAASAMYEQAFRLNQYTDSDALEKQVKCLLAAKNALSLCDANSAYIVMPVDSVEKEVINIPMLLGTETSVDVR